MLTQNDDLKKPSNRRACPEGALTWAILTLSGPLNSARRGVQAPGILLAARSAKAR
jgi:hypothetical protein